MEKKVFKRTQNIFVQKNIFDKLNEKIEKICLNSKVIFLVEPYYFLKYKQEIFELKKYSLNFINIIVIENCGDKFLNKIQNMIDESVSLLIVLGKDESFDFGKILTTKNNINSIFLCENCSFNAVLSGFCWQKREGFLAMKECLPPAFVVFKDISAESEIYNKCKCNYFSNLLFYNIENFLTSIFFDEKRINYYYDTEKTSLNNIIVNELFFQKNKINNTILREILFYSGLKSSSENNVLISLILLGIYRGFIAKLSFTNYKFKNYSESLNLLSKFDNSLTNRYLNEKNINRKRICYQIVTARNFLLNQLDKTIKGVKNYCNCLKLLDCTEFEKIQNNFNFEKILAGIKITAKVTQNKTFLKIIDEMDLFV